MTLVIAQKRRNQISLSSDSRISFGSYGHIDYGIKVLTIPVKIFLPTSSETNITELVYDYKLGLAIVGSAINAYTVKESVCEILQNLQCIPGFTDLSMDGIAKLVFNVFKKTTIDLGDIIQKKGICGLILTGYCPSQNRIRVFNYSCDTSNYPIKPLYEEILEDDGMKFFGSGEDEAERIYAMNNSLTPLHIIKEVIKSGNVDSVGGGLQYGEFLNHNYIIYGIADFELHDDGTFKEDVYTLRGINLYRDEFERSDEGFHIAYTFKTPFEAERDEIFRQQYGDNLQ